MAAFLAVVTIADVTGIHCRKSIEMCSNELKFKYKFQHHM